MKSKKVREAPNQNETTEKAIDVWAFVNSISYNKKYLFDDVTADAYDAFTVNKALSYFPDTIVYANEMNRNYDLDKKLQHDYLINIVRRRNRFEKWVKNEKDADLQAVQQYYKYNVTKAKEALKILTEEQLAIIRKRIDRGGLSK